MQPGPDRIITCPECNGLAKYFTLVSGNTLGQRTWTDGKQVAPMLPTPPNVVKCRHCAECYWLCDADEIGTMDLGGAGQEAHPEWAEARYVEAPTEEEYYEAFERGFMTRSGRERELRILAWWRGNDRYRDTPPEETAGAPTPSDPRSANLRALASVLTQDRNDRIMRADVLRQLGEFDSARQALDEVDSPEIATVVRQIQALCDARDTVVGELDLAPAPPPDPSERIEREPQLAPAPHTPQMARILEQVQEGVSLFYGTRPGTVDLDRPLRELGGGLFEINFVELLEHLEGRLGVTVPDEAWHASSTPNWEYATQRSLAEVLDRTLSSRD